MRVRLRRAAWDMFRQLRGTYLIEGAGGLIDPNGAQCTHVPNAYWRRLGMGQLFLNASGFIGSAPIGGVWIPTSSLGHLEVGDTAIFNPEFVGPNGHVDIVLDGSRRAYAGMDQNWPLGAPVSEVWHERAMLVGVIRPVG